MRLHCGCESGASLPCCSVPPAEGRYMDLGARGTLGLQEEAAWLQRYQDTIPCHPSPAGVGSPCPLWVGVGSPFVAHTSTMPFPLGPPISPHAGSLLQGWQTGISPFPRHHDFLCHQRFSSRSHPHHFCSRAERSCLGREIWLLTTAQITSVMAFPRPSNLSAPPALSR